MIKKLFILILLGLTLICLHKSAFADTFYVEIDGSDSNDGSSDDAGDAFLTIQGALDNDSVEDYDTIYIGEGTFTENITITKKVTLSGEGQNNTVIQAENSSGNIITVSSDDVSIKNIGISGSDDTDTVGIYVGDGVEDFYLYYCELSGNAVGCYLYNTDDAVIDYNDFTENETGLYLYAANDTTVAENDFDENTYGIYAYNAETEDISDNSFEENDYGIYLDDSDGYFSSSDEDDLESENSFDDNIEEDVYLDDGDDISCFISSSAEPSQSASRNPVDLMVLRLIAFWMILLSPFISTNFRARVIPV